MNQRIKELMMQSWNTYYNEEVNGSKFPVVQKFDAEKFAELIVRDSIIDFYRRYLDLNSNEDITVQVERYIKEHFYGVEECVKN